MVVIHFPKKCQYLVNGESDQKSVTNKNDVNFNFFLEYHIKFNVSSAIIVLLQLKQKLEIPHYLINGEFDQKSS